MPIGSRKPYLPLALLTLLLTPLFCWVFGCQQDTRQKVHVLVAASALDSVTEILDQLRLQPEFPSNDIQLVVASGPSSGLAAQILAGSPADIFISANQQWAEAVSVSQGRAGESVALMRNRLVLAIPRSTSGGSDRSRQDIRSIADLSDDSIQRIATAAESVPAGQYARQAIESSFDSNQRQQAQQKNAVRRKLVFGRDVRSVVAYLERAEVDAGFIYATDVPGSNLGAVVTIDESLHEPIVYWAVRKGESEAARRIFDQLRSDSAAKIFEQHGFAFVAVETSEPVEPGRLQSVADPTQSD